MLLLPLAYCCWQTPSSMDVDRGHCLQSVSMPTHNFYLHMAVIVLLLFPFSRLLEHVGMQECIVRACFGCLSALRDPSAPALSFGVTPLLCALLSSIYQAGSPGEGRCSHERGIEEGNYPSAFGFRSGICLGRWGFKFTQRKLFVSGY